MKILALIPARGGSKRLPGKNIRALGGRPLIAWSVNCVKGIAEISDILVSTDDPAIAAAARDAGAMVPWLRPAELATDTASSADVALHALEWYAGAHGEVDGLMLLQPTSPFRRRETVLTGIDLFREHQGRPVVGVSPASFHPFWCYEIKEGVLRPLVDGADTELRSQDLPPAYVVNGVFYLVAPGDLRRAQSFQYPDMAPLIVEDPKESIDIDTEWDWRIAEAALPLIDGH